MSKIETLTTVTSGFLSTQQLNDNFDKITTALENTLSLDGSTPNAMDVELDMNSHKITNVTDGVDAQDAATVNQIQEILDLADDFETSIAEAEAAAATATTKAAEAAASAASIPTLATGMATFLETPSSANLAATVTDEVGTGTLAFQESGSWTPTFLGTTTAGTPTYSSQLGRYRRTGNVVTITGICGISNKGGMTGNIRLSGLPFAAASSNGSRAGVSFASLTGLNLPAAYSIHGFLVQTTTYFDLQVMDLTTGTSALLDTEISDTFQLGAFSLTYNI